MQNDKVAEVQTLQLIEKIRLGDLAAYDNLFEREIDRLLLYIEHRLGKRLGAKVEPIDVLQETFLEAHRTFDRFEYRGPRSFRAWLCRIASSRINKAADWFGAKKRSIDKEFALGSALLVRLQTQATKPLSDVIRSEKCQQLTKGLEQLEDEEKEVILLRFFQELTVSEIAAELKISLSTVKRLLVRATYRLGSLLEE